MQAQDELRKKRMEEKAARDEKRKIKLVHQVAGKKFVLRGNFGFQDKTCAFYGLSIFAFTCLFKLIGVRRKCENLRKRS